MKALKSLLFIISLMLLRVNNLFAQSEPEMADQFRADGKIYVVVTVIVLVFAGLAFWLFRLDRRIRNMENEHKD